MHDVPSVPRISWAGGSQAGGRHTSPSGWEPRFPVRGMAPAPPEGPGSGGAVACRDLDGLQAPVDV